MGAISTQLDRAKLNSERRLCFLVCENFRLEVKAVLAEGIFKDASFRIFNADCGRPPLSQEKVKQVFASATVKKGEKICLLGACCLSNLMQASALPRDWQLHLLDQCFYLFAPQEMVEKCISQGDYLLTPGYLKKWKKNIEQMGLDQTTAREMYAETTRTLVLLDTGVDPQAKENLEEFALYLNLPYKILEVGLSNFKGLLEKLILEWRLETEKKRVVELSNQLARQKSDIAMTMDIIGQLTGSIDENEAIMLTLELFTLLFAPTELIYYPISGSKLETASLPPSTLLDEDLTSDLQKWIDQPEDWRELEDGFVVRICHKQFNLGFIVLRKVALPEYLTNYLNTALDIAKVSALAIYNARMFQKLLSSQKMADLGTLSAGVAHEINSPLQVITGVSDTLYHRFSENLDQDFLKTRLETINRNAWRVSEIIRALLVYSHTSPQEMLPYDLNAIVRDTLLLIENQLKTWSNIVIHTKLQPDMPALPCDHNKISQAIINLLTNAQDALPKGGEINICTSRVEMPNLQILSISDNGEGIPREIQGRIFNPFFTTKPFGKGTGLGLSIVQGIVQAHKGRIEINSSPDKGTTISLYIPEYAAPMDEYENPFQGRFDDH
jgi:signal transduction histidine kinase